MQFMELALAVSRFTGRVHIRQRQGRTAGFGTGFMVSPRLLLTNNHVLPTPEFAAHSEIEFDFQNDRRGRPLPVVVYGLEPDVFFLTNEHLDYTLIAARPMSVSGKDLKLYGWNRLDPEQGKALLGDALNIVQHPKGEPKQIVLRSNQLVDLLSEFAHYATDTEPGSSGSPVYNDQWEVVALHHSGVPKTDADGNFLTIDGAVWTAGMDPALLDWVANEGIRVSTLMAHITAQALPTEEARQLRREMLERQPPDPLEAAAMAADADAPRQIAVPGTVTRASTAGMLEVIVPIHISIRVSDVKVTGGLPDSAIQAVGAGTPVGGTPIPLQAGTETAGLTEARTRLENARSRPYYDAPEDARARRDYYREVALDDQPPAELYRTLSALLRRTHTRVLSYTAARQQHLYPVVDLRPNGKLRSIYTGDEYEPEEILREDFAITEALRAEALRRFGTTPGREAFVEAQLEILEAAAPYNAEHVVPQSWFRERSPMKSDLHHLFTCEMVCNSFRGNTPYFEFADFGEADRVGCGRRVENRFEPAFGHGPASRATLYFLLRYPGEVNANEKEYTAGRLEDLLEWHRRDPVAEYERHRNAEIHRSQGNRNPLIDFPDLAAKINFASGLGVA